MPERKKQPAHKVGAAVTERSPAMPEESRGQIKPSSSTCNTLPVEQGGSFKITSSAWLRYHNFFFFF